MSDIAGPIASVDNFTPALVRKYPEAAFNYMVALADALKVRSDAGEVETQWRAVWPGGSTSMPLPSRVPLDEEFAKRGLVATVQKRTANYGPWVEASQ